MIEVTDMSFGKVLIFGDSYSTFEGYIPEGYASYYPPSIEGRPKITDVRDTWWHLLIEETKSNLVLNDSWSGSTVGYTGYGGQDTSGFSSFITRLEKMIERGFFSENKIDTVFIFGGTNDSWSDAPLGKAKYENVQRDDRYFVLPAICDLIRMVKEALPEARIIYVINTDIKTEIADTVIEASNKYGIEYILLENIDKMSDHPTVLGMKQIKEQIAKKLV